MQVLFGNIIPLVNNELHKFVIMDSGPVKLYSSFDSPRLRYIAGIILGDILGLKWDLVTDRRKLGKHPVLNYSSEKLQGSFCILPHPILFESGVSQQDVNISQWNGLPVMFQNFDCDFPFDLFAASFFLISRYEEYLEFKPDEFGRFPACLSVAYKNGFLDRPVIDLWARELAKAFLKRFPTLAFRRNEYKALLTLDTDQPFAYQGQNIFRSLGGLLHDKNDNPVPLGERYRIISKTAQDPFDVFDYITDSINRNGTDTKFFFPVGDRSKFDINPSWKNEEYRKLIHKIAARFQIGLHPSFNAGEDDSLVFSEAARLRTILKKEVSISRFHYLRLSMPRSYNGVIKAGISDDFSMGYPDEPGFRAGIARPYWFFNVLDDIQTNLQITPFQIMDATLIDYKKFGHVASKELILKLISETRKAGGLFVSIWHNTSLLDNDDRKGWRDVFEYMLKIQKP
jgi:hypothetical protein